MKNLSAAQVHRSRNGQHGWKFVLLLVLLALAFISVPAFGQTTVASLSGTITDPNEAVVPGAKITATDVDRGYEYTAVADETGRYALRNMRPAVYKLSVSAAGFKTFVQDRITLELSLNATLNVKMELGALNQSVEVSSQAPLLATEDAMTGQSVNQTFVNNLPLVGRAVFNLAMLAPGVTESAGYASGGLTFISNGTRAVGSDVLIDGVSSTTPQVNTGAVALVYSPTVDAVQEFKVLQSNYGADIGFSTDAVITVITRSGTNEFHGSAYEFHRNSALNANSFFNNKQNRKKSPTKINTFGTTLGGPVIKNKTFFFFDLEFGRTRSYGESQVGVPSPAMKAGNFGEVCADAGGVFDSAGRCSKPEGQIWDPYSGAYDAARGGAVRSGFIPFNDMRTYTSPGNPRLDAVGLNPKPVPGNLIDPVALKILSYFPEPNINFANGQRLAGYNRYNNFFGSGTSITNRTQWEVKIDHRFGSNDWITGKYSIASTYSAPRQLFANAMDPLSSGPSWDPNRHISLNYNHSFSPTTLLNATLGFARNPHKIDGTPGFYPDFDPAKDLGLPAMFNKGGTRFGPGLSLSGSSYTTLGSTYWAIGPMPWKYERINSDNWTMVANMTHMRGRHELKFGGEVRLAREYNYDPGNAGGTFAFSRFGTSQYPTSGGGDDWATILTGTSTNGSGSYPITLHIAPQSISFAGYFQENWRATDRLTLNLGMRYELPLPVTERFNNIGWLDPYVTSPLQVPGLPKLTGGAVFASAAQRSPYNADTNNISPRFGFAYKWKSETVVRGGFGIFYATPKTGAGGITGGGYTGMSWSTPWTTTYQFDGATPYTRLSNPFPDGIQDPIKNSLGLMTLVGRSISNPIRTWNTIPETYSWSFGVQRALPGSMVVDASYVGTKGTHLYFGGAENLDFFPATIESASRDEITRMNTKIPNPFYGYITDPLATLSAPTVTASQLQKLHPQFTGFSGTGNPVGNSIYHSFQLRVEKRLSKGLQVLMTYTNSKSIDDTSVTSGSTAWSGGSTSLQNPNKRFLERSVSMFDIPQVFQLSYVYQMPFGRGMKWGGGWHPVIDAFLGGWQTNGIWRRDNGQPLVLGTSGGQALPSYGGQRPNLLAPLVRNEASNKDVWMNQYFANPTDAVLPPPYTVGNAPRTLSSVRTPGNFQNDMSLFKSFTPKAIKEGLRIELRAEFYNALNHPLFGGPSTTVNTANFGRVTSQRNSARQVQVAMKIYF